MQQYARPREGFSDIITRATGFRDKYAYARGFFRVHKKGQHRSCYPFNSQAKRKKAPWLFSCLTAL